jgi:hypothetical protein
MARRATSARPGPLANAVNNQWIAVVAVGTISAQPVDLVAANPEMIQRIWAITASAASADIVAEYTVNNQGIWCGEHSGHLADVVIGYIRRTDAEDWLAKSGLEGYLVLGGSSGAMR